MVLGQENTRLKEWKEITDDFDKSFDTFNRRHAKICAGKFENSLLHDSVATIRVAQGKNPIKR